MRTITQSVVIIPFLAIILVPILPPESPEVLAECLKLIIAFYLQFLALNSMIFLVVKVGGVPRKFSQLAIFVLGSLVFLGMLHLISLAVSSNLFYFILTLVFLRCALPRVKDYNWKAWLAALYAYRTGVGVTTFLLFNVTTLLPILLLSLALAGTTAATECALRLLEPDMAPPSSIRREKKSTTKLAPPISTRVLRRTYAISLVFGPLLIGLMAMMDLLNSYYMGVLVLLPLASKLIDKIELKEAYVELPANFLTWTSGFSVIFVVIIQALGLL